MRIAFVCQPWDVLQPSAESGSVQVDTLEAARRMARQQVNVIIYAPRGRGQRRAETFDGVELRRISTLPDRCLLALLKPLARLRRRKRPLFSSRFYFLGYVLQAAIDARRRQCDAVQLINFSQFAPTVRALNPSAVIALEMACEWLTDLDDTVVRPRLRHVDVIQGVSDYIRDRIASKFPEHAFKCRTLRNGRDVSLFKPAPADAGARRPGTGHVLFVGRLSPEKGVHVLLEAFAMAAERVAGARLTLVGPCGSPPREFVYAITSDPRIRAMNADFPGDYRLRLLSMVPPHLQDSIVFAGKIPNRQLPDLYRNADVVAFPSIWNEPSGNPPIEAMASGVPVVSTFAGGIPEYVEHGKTGLLVEPGNAQALADAIVTLLTNDRLRAEMGAAGRRRAVDRFSCEHFVQAMLEQYGEAMRRR